MECTGEFASIYREFKPRVLRYLGRLVGEEDAADLAQEVMLKVNKSFAGFRGDSSLATWIYRIAANTAHDHRLSSHIRQRKQTLPLGGEDVSIQLIDHTAPGTDQEYIRREMTSCIRGVVEQLPENYRAVLLLSEFEEFSNAEIAQILDLSIDTVKIRLHRGRTHLRRSLTCQCDLYRDENNELACDRKADK
jgi:RNA polymerase sigma-70 factor (ECF subfamily)